VRAHPFKTFASGETRASCISKWGGVLTLCLFGLAHAGTPSAVPDSRFGKEPASQQVRYIADWVVDAADNRGLPFIIIDKKDAKAFIFDSTGALQDATAVLLGMAIGDHTVPGIGEREYSDMPPDTRTTPAGRFVAEMGVNERNESIVWVDYEAAVSLHRVVTSNPQERRLQRLATPTPRDNRISYGCINVPVRFFENSVSPAFTPRGGIVYVLPEVRALNEVFAAYDVKEKAGAKVLAEAL
jgi:hypothetical protein